MKKVLMGLLACLTLSNAISTAHAADPVPAKLVGHYYLHGAHEVGSELLLKRDGTFEWALAYGSMDQQSKGRWIASDTRVKLVANGPAREPVFRLFTEKEFDELGISGPASAGKWKVIVAVLGRGGIGDVEVLFEARSGASLLAMTDWRGDAFVRMPATETWALAGVRLKDSKSAYQWFTIPPAQAQGRYSGFTLTDDTWLSSSPFKVLDLEIEPTGLRTPPDTIFNGGVYVMDPKN